ncbi:hypothetical protein V6N12_016039 [Hibiscus sabdariffa]|uniref:Reverse transcriptase zinc-binding domain-containing protein n=1 Tax=Hibiscus sabdariffa TaxID=183260 RepID=A0ABR1Z6E6_9ROSI
MTGCLTMPLMRGKDCTRLYRTSGAVSCLYPTLARHNIDRVATTQSLPTLPKVRIFAWRLAHDCLPTGSWVAAAGLDSGLCPFCSTTVETSLHAFRDCPSAAKALHLGGFPISVADSRADSIFGWLVEAAEPLDS